MGLPSRLGPGPLEVHARGLHCYAHGPVRTVRSKYPRSLRQRSSRPSCGSRAGVAGRRSGWCGDGRGRPGSWISSSGTFWLNRSVTTKTRNEWGERISGSPAAFALASLAPGLDQDDGHRVGLESTR